MIREYPPLRLGVRIVPPTGPSFRWAGDRPAEDVPQGMQFSSTCPGGFERFDCSLSRRPARKYSDLTEFSTLIVEGAGGRRAGEFRLEGAPRQSGDQIAISPSGVGWQAALEDNKSVQEVYVDRDMARWGGISTARHAALLTAGYRPEDGSTAPDSTTGAPAVIETFALEGNSKPICEMVYDAGSGILIGYIYYDYTAQNAGLTSGDPAWTLLLRGMSGDDFSGSVNSANLLATALSGVGIYTPSTPKRYGALEFAYESTTAAAPGTVRQANWRNVAVYGTHGLTRRGSDPGGFYASDVIGDAVSRWAPSLKTSRAGQSTVTGTTFVIPHLAFNDPTTVAEVVKQSNRFHLNDWAVWDDRTFWYYPPGGGLTRKWRARTGPAKLADTGLQADRIWNSIIVQYTDVSGKTATVGPPGSGADTISTDLVDPSSTNPATYAGLTRRDVLVMGTGTAASATRVGLLFLQQAQLLDHSGSAQLTGYVIDDRGVIHPAWAVRAGDYVSFSDASDTSYRKIVRASYDDPSKTCSIDLDAPPDALQAILERLSVVLVPLGVA